VLRHRAQTQTKPHKPSRGKSDCPLTSLTAEFSRPPPPHPPWRTQRAIDQTSAAAENMTTEASDWWYPQNREATLPGSTHKTHSGRSFKACWRRDNGTLSGPCAQGTRPRIASDKGGAA